jgi:thiol-disulfide isomerase/thioredoxin
MKHDSTLIFSFLILLILTTFFLTHCTNKKSDLASTTAPDFTLKTLEQEEITLSKLKGKPVLLDFWATWCGPCRESIPHLISLYKNYQSKGVEVIGISMDKGEIERVRNFVKSMNIPYPIAIASPEVVQNYRVTNLPTTFFINKEGKIQEKIVGFNSQIAERMKTLLEELSSGTP